MSAATSSPVLALGAALVLSLATALGGCGESKDPVDAAVVQQRLTRVADALDACVAKTNDARKCADAKALGLPEDGLLGDGVGEVEISASKPLRYQLVGRAGDDVEFAVLAQPVGARKRVCKPAGKAPCAKGGVW